MRIILAEDDPVARRLVTRALEDLGHTAIVVEDGEQAWDAFLEERPDVIISDWQMPKCNGIELCERVRAHGDGYTYFILLTSHNEHAERLNGMRAGADDYLAKPLKKIDLTMRLIAAKRITNLHARLREQQEELERLNQELYRDGRRCALTGIANRLQLNEDLAKLHAMTHRHRKPFCVAIFDVDYFKLYNDTCGHVAGDEVLRQVAKALKSAARLSDRVYRYGGEEFLAVYVFGEVEGARIAADRMRAAVEALAIPHPGRPDLDIVTLSGGVIAYTGDPKYSVAELIEAADKALYAAKQSGKNCIVTA